MERRGTSRSCPNRPGLRDHLAEAQYVDFRNPLLVKETVGMEADQRDRGLWLAAFLVVRGREQAGQ